MKDKPVDEGGEPDPATAALNMWESEDIWVRSQNGCDAGTTHQNAEFGQPNCVYVKLRNRDQPASGTLHVYYAEAALGLAWGTTNWTEITIGSAASLAASATVVIGVPWSPPDPGTGSGHFCLLARWESPSDPMTWPETSDINSNTRNNNNIAWKNIHIENLVPGAPAPGDGFIVRNTLSKKASVDIVVRESNATLHDRFLAHGRVYVDLGPELFAAWRKGGLHGSGLGEIEGTRVRVLDPEGASIENIRLRSREEHLARLFIQAPPADADPGPAVAYLEVSQRESDTGFVFGGITFEIRSPADFGDAPDSYKTTLGANGPRHQVTGLRLGSKIDSESDGAPTVGANGDDSTGIPDDEDGVAITGLAAGSTATAQVVLTNAASAKLDGWVDFDGNGVFGAAEQVFSSTPIVVGPPNMLPFAVPSSAKSGATYARFRVSPIGSAPLGPAGLGSPGEVEDYRVDIGGLPPALQHGIAFTKGCTSPTVVGDPYQCSYTVRNILDTAHDTLTIKGLVDTVHSSGGDVNSGNVIGAVQITVAGGATCVGGAGTGTIADPYVGVTSCTLPFGSRVNVLSYSFYTVVPADQFLPLAVLSDNAFITWQDLCDSGASNCPHPGDRQTGSGSSTAVGPGTPLPAPQHGIGFTKGCESPTVVGAPYLCSYTIQNVLDEAFDTLTVDSLVDCVFPATSQPCSGNILSDPTMTLKLSGGAYCDGIPVNGTGTMNLNGKCTLPFGSRIDTNSFSSYIAAPGDIATGIYDEADLTWQDICDGGALNCPQFDQRASTGSST